jgi:hypothetical protein
MDFLMRKNTTHYDTLEVMRSASDIVIRAAYRGLSQKHHPDKNINNSDYDVSLMTRINEAYSILSDPKKRRDYDVWLKDQELNAQASDSVFHSSDLEEPSSTNNDFSDLSDTDDLVIEADENAHKLGLYASIIFVIVAFFMISDDNKLFVFISVLGIITFSSTAFIFLVRLTNQIPILKITKDHITVGNIPLKWFEISEIIIKTDGSGYQYLALVPNDPENFILRLPKFRRFLDIFTSRDAALYISELSIEMPLETLKLELERRLQLYRHN